jgi:hypothetical protein
MSIHVGQITSEVRAAPAAGPADDASSDASSVWDERVRVAGALQRAARDRRRTATGLADD